MSDIDDTKSFIVDPSELRSEIAATTWRDPETVEMAKADASARGNTSARFAKIEGRAMAIRTQQIEQNGQQVHQLNDRLNQLSGRSVNQTLKMKERLTAQSSALKSVRQQLEDVRSAKQTVDGELASTKEQLGQKTQKLSEIEGRVPAIEDELKRTQTELQETKEQLGQKTQELSEIEGRVPGIEDELKRTKTELQGSKEQLGQKTQKLSEIEGRVPGIEDELERTQTELQDSKEQLTQKSQELTTIKGRVPEVEEQLKQTKSELKRTKEELDTKQQEFADVSTQMSEIESKREALQSEHNSLIDDYNELVDEFTELDADLTNAELEKANAEELADACDDELRERELELERKEGEFENMQDELALTQRWLSNANDKLFTAEDGNRQSALELADTRRKLKEAQDALAKAKIEHETAMDAAKLLHEVELGRAREEGARRSRMEQSALRTLSRSRTPLGGARMGLMGAEPSSRASSRQPSRERTPLSPRFGLATPATSSFGFAGSLGSVLERIRDEQDDSMLHYEDDDNALGGARSGFLMSSFAGTQQLQLEASQTEKRPGSSGLDAERPPAQRRKSDKAPTATLPSRTKPAQGQSTSTSTRGGGSSRGKRKAASGKSPQTQSSSSSEPTQKEIDPMDLPVMALVDGELTDPDQINPQDPEFGDWLRTAVRDEFASHRDQIRSRQHFKWLTVGDKHGSWCYRAFVIGVSKEPIWQQDLERLAACSGCASGGIPCAIHDNLVIIVLPIKSTPDQVVDYTLKSTWVGEKTERRGRKPKKFVKKSVSTPNLRALQQQAS